MPYDTLEQFHRLDDEDIEILFEIYSAAARNPECAKRPKAATFKAYDQVLTQRGLRKDYDTKWLRFLLHAKLEPGVHPLDHFKAVLAGLGITIEIDPDGEGVVGDGVPPVVDDDDGAQPIEDTSPQHVEKARSRRASFNSMYDVQPDGATWHEEVKEDAPAFPDYTKPHGRTPNGTEHAPVHKRTTSDTQQQFGLSSRLPIRGRMIARSASEEPVPTPRRRNRSTSTQGSLRITRPRHVHHPQEDDSDFYSSSVDNDAIDAAAYAASFPQKHYIPPVPVFRPSDTQMLAEADTFEQRHIRITARRYLLQWRDQAIILYERHQDMEDRAFHHDSQHLKRDALSAWREALRHKRAVADNERYWQKLEQRAVRYRDVYLLTKAFTHWAATAAEAAQRTSVARRHMLRTRYFNAWREITAVNELKVRQFQLHAFLRVWKRRTGKVIEDRELAEAVYRRNLMRRVHHQLVETLAERVAGRWHAQHVMQDFFRRWRDVVWTLRQREEQARVMRDHDVQRKALASWAARAATIREQDRAAEEFRRRALLRNGFDAIRREAEYRPLMARVASHANHRVVDACFSTWRRATELQVRAKKHDRMRLLRNAFTAWNDRLRCQAMAYRINDRIVAEALYKWYIAGRAALFKRAREANLTRKLLLQWREKALDQCISLEEAEERFYARQRYKILDTCFQRLRAAAQFRQQQEGLALSVYEPRLVQRCMQAWWAKHEHIVRLEKMGSDAQEYVLTKHTLERWRDATHHAQRRKRREAYATIRRKHKVNLVRAAFGVWQDLAGRYAVMDRQAQDVWEDHLWSAQVDLFTRWREKASLVLQQNAQAENVRQLHLLTQTFSRWTAEHGRIEALDAKAATMRADLAAIAAADALKKLKWRAFNIARQAESAGALHEMHFRRHVGGMIRYWADKAVLARDIRLRDSPPSPSPQPRRHDHPAPLDDDDDDDDVFTAMDLPGAEPTTTTARTAADDYTALDDSAFPLTLNMSFMTTGGGDAPLTSTPLPGYLRTPSKRTTVRTKLRERALLASSAAAAAVPLTSTTPAGPPPPLFRPTTTPATNAATTTTRPGSFTVARARTAPPAAAAAADASSVPASPITPFRNKLRAGGFLSAQRRPPPPGMTPASSGSGFFRRSAMAVPGSVGRGARPGRDRVGFVGFEDISEEKVGEVSKGDLEGG